MKNTILVRGSAALLCMLLCVVVALGACAPNNGGGGDNGQPSTPVQPSTPIVEASSITLSKDGIQLTNESKNRSETLVATIFPENTTNKNVTWTVADKKVATVDSNGKVEFVSEGETVVEAMTSNGKKATCYVSCRIPYSEKVVMFSLRHDLSENLTANSKYLYNKEGSKYSILSEIQESSTIKTKFHLCISNNEYNVKNPLSISAIDMYPTIGQTEIRIVDDLLLATLDNVVKVSVSAPYGDGYVISVSLKIYSFTYTAEDGKLKIEDFTYDYSELTKKGYSKAQANKIALEAANMLETSIDALRDYFIEKDNMDIYRR